MALCKAELKRACVCCRFVACSLLCAPLGSENKIQTALFQGALLLDVIPLLDCERRQCASMVSNNHCLAGEV